MLGIGQLARRTGTCPETIRYFEKEGLLPAPRRSAAGHRRYEAHHETTLTFILRARGLGFRPAEVRQLLEVMSGDHPCGEVRTLARRHLDAIRRRRRALQQMERLLGDLVQHCDERPETARACPVVEKLQEPFRHPAAVTPDPATQPTATTGTATG